MLLISSGRCTEGYEIQLNGPAVCPTFRKMGDSAPSTLKNSSTPDNVFCSILVGDPADDKCLDISGESAVEQAALIGYDCTGRWNQLFRLTADCRIAATQPAVISRVRGHASEGPIELCVEALETNHLATAVCGARSTEDEGKKAMQQRRQEFELISA
jgi:hypothetical protein